MNLSIKKVLEELNYNKKEIDIYLASLELGIGSAKDIANRAGVRRTTFYDLIGNIVAQGLLRQISKGKRRYFTAISPDDFFSYQKEKITRLEAILPEMRSIYHTKGFKPRIFFYEGDALEKIYEDLTKYEKETIDIFSSPRFFFGSHERNAREIIEKRISKRSKVRLITEITSETMKLKQSDPETLRETRLLPQNLYHSNIEIGMYANKIYVVDFKESFGFIIESIEMTNTLRMIFSMIWNSGRVIK
ncbi:hypothetical protein HYW94_00040 [Candidatus Uhrbacteria bacterium]|nr:hypothetical protein [Candidatus Uhrbacteria bacterium]